MRPVQSVLNEVYVNYSLDGANDYIFVPLGVYQIPVRYLRSDISSRRNWLGNELEITSYGIKFRTAFIDSYGIKFHNSLTMKISTPTVSPHFSKASERSRKMQCTFVRISSLNFIFGGRETVTTKLHKREYFETRADS